MVKALIHRHKEEEPPGPLEASETEQTPVPSLEVPEGYLMPPAELEPAEVVVTAPMHCLRQEKHHIWQSLNGW